MTRRWDIDALRGLMLVLMTITHLPTRLSAVMGQPFGFVSAAEGFVLLSAFMAGLVYSQLARQQGIEAMRQAFWRRALKLYGYHVATLIFLFTVIAALGVGIDEPAVKNLMSFYLAQPLTAWFTGLLLIYEPPLLDILPMYIFFLLLSPWVLSFAMRRRSWKGVMALSLGLWLLAQFGLGRSMYEATVALTGLTVPVHETGAFVIVSWQFLWTLGLWMGASRSSIHAVPLTFPSWLVVLAVCVAAIGLVWRHVEGQAAFALNDALNMLFDKWSLGPLRLLNMLALIVVTMRFGPALRKRMARLRWLEALGAVSLPVFCAHLVAVLLVLALLGSDPLQHPWWVDGLLLMLCFLLLFGVARVTTRLDGRRPVSGGPGQGSSAADALARFRAELPPSLAGTALGAPQADALQSCAARVGIRPQCGAAGPR